MYNKTLRCSYTAEVSLFCPDDFSVTADPGLQYSINVTWPQPIITGGDNHVTLTSELNPGITLDIGNHSIVYCAESNRPAFSITCTFIISVYGNVIS